MNKKYGILFLMGGAAASILIMQQRCPVIPAADGQQTHQVDESEPAVAAPHGESASLAEPSVISLENTEQTDQREDLQPTALTPHVEAAPVAEQSAISIKNAEQAKKQITVKNGITEKMIAYTKGFMQYVPEFSVTVNDVAIEPGKQKEITLNDDKLVVEYRYNFCKGYKVGMKRIEFIIPQEKDAVTLNFSWKDDWRVLIPGAQPNKVLAEEG